MSDQEPRPSTTGTASPSTAGEANVLRGYATVLRRRWLWVALGLLVGLSAGVASTILVKEERDPNNYYKATNTQVGPPSLRLDSDRTLDQRRRAGRSRRQNAYARPGGGRRVCTSPLLLV